MVVEDAKIMASRALNAKKKAHVNALVQLTPLPLDLLVRKRLLVNFDGGILEAIELIAGKDGTDAIIKGWYGE